MNQVVKEQWLRALRSGAYQQNRGALRTGDQFCCLGVLCDLASKQGVGQWTRGQGTYIFDTRSDIDGENLLLPPAVQDWAGLEIRNPKVKGYYGIADFNDGTNEEHVSLDFPALADLIETSL